MDVHKQAVAKISEAVRGYFLRREPFRVYHGSTNSTRPGAGASAGRGIVDISQLDKVLRVDTQTRTALVEPNVPMDRLVAATLAHGLVPPVVMEFPGITAGGGFAGTAGESSSFRHGFFNQTVDRVEMILGNGDLIDASPAVQDPRRDLFQGAAGALGTLGLTTLLELRLEPACRFVRTTYHRRSSVRATIDLIRDLSAPDSPYDYVDGILYAPDHGVVITGERTDNPPPSSLHLQTFSRPRDPWFYMHVRDRTVNPAVSPTIPVDYVPLPEYLFRYDRGGFWVGRSAFSYFPFPCTPWTRRLLDDFLHTRMLYKALHASGQSATYIVQDLALPYSTAENFVDYTATTFGIWPLWLCPLQETQPPTFHPHSQLKTSQQPGSPSASASLLNIGLWGPGPPDVARCVALNRNLEQRLLHDYGGMKWLYSHAYYDEDTFWRIYNRPAYDQLRQKYHATSLPTVYDKVKVDAVLQTAAPPSWADRLARRWPLAGAVGLRHAIASKAYLPRIPPWRVVE